MLAVRKASPEDIPRITELLRNAELGVHGVDKQESRFLVVEETRSNRSRIVGTVGLEIHGEKGLLRSFVMESEAWNARVGLELIGTVLTFARRTGLKEVYLLAGIAHHIFEYFGFTPVAWEELPRDIRESEHMKRTDSETAVPMVYRNPDPEPMKASL